MLETVVRVGQSTEHRGAVVTPLFARLDPVAAYVTLDEALPRGFRVRETAGAATVPELIVDNQLDEDVLLYDGEELAGAMQDRILNVSVLVAAKSTVSIPVSCVERGRWHAQSAAFDAAPHAAHPSLRRRKAAALQARPLDRGVAQSAVWDEVERTADRLGVASPTGANADAFRAHRPAIAGLEAAFPLQPGQTGAVVVIAGEVCLDLVSRPAAFARLWPKLRSGYLLDALGRLDGTAARPEAAEEFVAALTSCTVTRRPSAGGGTDVRLEGPGILGSGLELDGELLQFSAFGRERPRRDEGTAPMADMPPADTVRRARRSVA